MPFPRPTAAIVLVAAGALLFGCGDNPAPPASIERTVVRDSAGVRIVENTLQELPTLAVAPPVLLEIGSLEGGSQELYSVGDVVRDATGRWMVANRGTSQILIFEMDGTPAGTIGRSGEGPGEFAYISSLFFLPGDSLLAWDVRQRRASVFDPEGELARTFVMRTVEGQSDAFPVGHLGGGILAAAGASTFGSEMSGESLARPEATQVLIDSEGQRLATLATIPGQEMWLNVGQDFVSVMEVPFARGSHLVVTGDRVAIGVTERGAFDLYDATGAHVERWRFDAPTPPVTDEDWSDVVTRILDEVEDAEARDLAATYDRMPRPEAHPAWSEIHAGSDGTFWVQEFAPPHSAVENHWLRFGSDGTLLHRLALPDGFEPKWSDADVVAGIVRDDFDVEYLRVYRMPVPGDG